MCLTCLHAHVPTCLACFRAHVPTCLASLQAHVPRCLTCLCVHVPTCLTCFACLCAHVINYKNKFSITCFPYIFMILLCLFPMKENCCTFLHFLYRVEAFSGCFDKLCTKKWFDFCLSITLRVIFKWLVKGGRWIIMCGKWILNM